MIKRHWRGEDDMHMTWYQDTMYPDLISDADDMRYINFRYSDSKVVPEPLTGYYPHEHARYGDILNKKRDNSGMDAYKVYQHYRRDD